MIEAFHYLGIIYQLQLSAIQGCYNLKTMTDSSVLSGKNVPYQNKSLSICEGHMNNMFVTSILREEEEIDETQLNHELAQIEQIMCQLAREQERCCHLQSQIDFYKTSYNQYKKEISLFIQQQQEAIRNAWRDQQSKKRGLATKRVERVLKEANSLLNGQLARVPQKQVHL